MCLFQQAEELGSFGHMILTLELRKEERSYGEEAYEARHVSGVSLHGCLVERQLCKIEKLKPELLWRTQGVRDARGVEYVEES